MLHKLFTRLAKQSSDLDVVIHIGAPKTGSSAIQRFCINNRSLLLEQGFYYPKHSLDRNGISGGHQSLLAQFLIEKNHDEAKYRFLRLLRRAKRQNACLLLSAEGFYGQADTFATLLDGLKVQVIGWFRSPVNSFVSNYNQTVKRHFSTRRLGDVCDGLLQNQALPHFTGDYLLGWGDALGDENCTFLPYGDSLKSVEDSIECQWLGLLNVPAKSVSKFNFSEARVNRSYVPEALELKRLLNYVLDESITPVCHRIDWLLQCYSDMSMQPDQPAAEYLTEKHILQLNKLFFSTNSRLSVRFPALKDVSTPVEIEQTDNDVSFNLGDVSAPFKMIRDEHPNDIVMLRQRVNDRLEKIKVPSFSLLRLAELFGIPFSEPPTAKELMPPVRLKVLLDERCKNADFLRELALMSELSGDLDSARKLIARALELRPNGPGIIKIHGRLHQPTIGIN